ncbi:coiled-coil domain-containing protein mad1 [Irineochytrium annulatum]|nr:coiled-coil domain-containing protein mad1 [Irineochytrium annulatum]
MSKRKEPPSPNEDVLASIKLRRETESMKRKISLMTDEYERKIIGMEKEKGALQVAMDDCHQKLAVSMTARFSWVAFKSWAQKAEDLRVFFFERDKTNTLKIQSLEEEARKERATFEKNYAACRQKNLNLAENVSLLEEELEDLRRQSTSQAEALRSEIKVLRTEMSRLTAEVRWLVSFVSQNHNILRMQRCEEANVTTRSFSFEMEPLREHPVQDEDSVRSGDEVIRRQLKEQVQYIKSIEADNVRLKREVHELTLLRQNVGKIEEEKRALERQLVNKTSLQNELARTMRELEVLVAEKKAWTAYLQEHDEVGMDSPQQLAQTLGVVRLELSSAKEKLGALAAEEKRLQHLLADAEGQLRAETRARAVVEEDMQRTSLELKNMESRHVLLQRDYERIKEHLKIYDLEAESLAKEGFDRLYLMRISDLEASLAEKNDMISAHQVKIADLEAQRNQLEEHIRVLQHEMEKRGTMADARILQLRDNPESQEYAIRKAKLDALEAENDALRKKVFPSSKVIPIESLNVLEMQCNAMKAEMSEKDKRMMRLKEVYAAKAQEYREAVFSLLGYKVDFHEGRVRLKSTFADADDPSFLFSSGANDEGTLQLVGGLPERIGLLQRQRQFYVDERGSVPAFLAAATLAGLEAGAFDGTLCAFTSCSVSGISFIPGMGRPRATRSHISANDFGYCGESSFGDTAAAPAGFPDLHSSYRLRSKGRTNLIV